MGSTVTVYFGLGSNQGDRRAHLEGGIDALVEAGLRTPEVSPVVETPALLPPGAPARWDRPYLNIVLRGEVETGQGGPLAWRGHVKAMEARAGRPAEGPRWAPRTLDIDILLWGDEHIRTDALTIPHPDLTRRSFVLTPLLHLAPRLRLPDGRRVFDLTRRDLNPDAPLPVPLWMGIVNLTPDSFSGDGTPPGSEAARATLREHWAAGAHIVDLGAESTRPRARPVEPEEEWRRLEETLLWALAHRPGRWLRPLVSVDTRHPVVARRALEAGADIVNDVSGLGSEEMLRIASGGGRFWVAMHALTVPADPSRTLAPDADPVAEVGEWVEARERAWARLGLDPGRIVIDPGLGFGKDALQSLTLMRRVASLRALGYRVLIGHSRKSFLGFAGNGGAPPPFHARDPETVGASLALMARGVDILRVHDVKWNVRAARAWSHIEGYGEG